MLSDILWILILCIFSFIGLKRPYIAYCCVIFADILKPQNLSFSILANKPLSLILTAIFFLSVVLNFKEIKLPRIRNITVLTVMFMLWLTLTTFYAEFQYLAWFKYDYSIKTIFLALFIPFVINSKVKFQFFLMTVAIATSYYFIVGGMTTAFEPTAYGQQLIVTRAGDSELTESSTLSMVSAMLLPIIFFLSKHSLFVKKSPSFKLLFILISFAALMTIIGTHARTGIIGLLILVVIIIFKTKHRFKIISCSLIVVMLMLHFATESWLERIGGLSSSNKESSAYGRIVVWKWTLDYVKERPVLGGGFMSYKANAGVLHLYGNSDIEVDYRANSGKAFHNIYFEVLGEHGYPGLIIFGLLIFFTLRTNNRLSKNSVTPWIRDAALSNNMAFLIFCGCGMFIGIAFSPWMYLFSGLAVALDNCQENENIRQLQEKKTTN